MKKGKEEVTYKASKKEPVHSPTEFVAETESLISMIVKAHSMFILMSKNGWTD